MVDIKINVELASSSHFYANRVLTEHFIREFADRVDWSEVSSNYVLSESFIREFADRVDWGDISYYQTLSESFIREFADRVDWDYISSHQTLSEDFIREFKDRLDWGMISFYQTLSESFIREFATHVYWDYISRCQKLSENFIRDFSDDLDWDRICSFQILSKEFMEEFCDDESIKLQQIKSHHDLRTLDQKRMEMIEYAEKYGLMVENDVLHAFREHKDRCGMFNKTIRYSEGNTYRDWRCDLDSSKQNSFGLGIFPKGNTPVTVKLEDWGVEVKRGTMGKARVWAFSI